MSFNRLPYDQCSYRQELAETTGPGIYQLGTPPNTCKPCHPSDPYIRLQKTGVALTRNSPLADVDSELTGRSRNASKCPEKNFIPSLSKWGSQAQGFGRECKETFGNAGGSACRGPNISTAAGTHMPGVSKVNVDNSDIFHPQECEGWSTFTENTRLSQSGVRGFGINRWEWHPYSSQALIEIPFDFNINSVMISKDTHRPCLARPFGQKAVWPTPHSNPMCETIVETRYNPVSPSSTSWQASEVIRQY
jgi:hypothetical protein